MNTCDHFNVEHDEEQIDVDEFKILDTGTCTDCGVRVRAWQDEDPDGATWGYDIINDKEEKVKI